MMRTNRALVLSLSAPSTLAMAAAVSLALTGCDTERKQQCDKFTAAMAPLQEGTPSPDTVDKVQAEVAALQLTDQPLHEYATNYKATLTVLSSTLKLKASAGPDGPPDGTEGVIKQNLKEARTDFDDISRYCSK
jgi:hypothetical protein